MSRYSNGSETYTSLARWRQNMGQQVVEDAGPEPLTSHFLMSQNL